MDKAVETAIIGLAILGFVGLLGGGRKWAFGSLVSALILTAVGVAGVLIYIYWTDTIAERRAKKIHGCAVAKVADPKCDEAPNYSDIPNRLRKNGGCDLGFLPGA